MSHAFLFKSLKIALLLQIIWYVMFFTNILGMIGSVSELLQDIVWIGISVIGLLISIAALFTRKFITLSVCTLLLSLSIIMFWYLITGIGKM